MSGAERSPFAEHKGLCARARGRVDRPYPDGISFKVGIPPHTLTFDMPSIRSLYSIVLYKSLFTCLITYFEFSSWRSCSPCARRGIHTRVANIQ